MTICRTNRVSWYQNATILYFIGAKDDGGGGDRWSSKMSEVPVKSSPPTAFYRPYALHVIQFSRALEGENIAFRRLLTPSSPRSLPSFSWLLKVPLHLGGRVTRRLISLQMPVPHRRHSWNQLAAWWTDWMWGWRPVLVIITLLRLSPVLPFCCIRLGSMLKCLIWLWCSWIAVC